MELPGKGSIAVNHSRHVTDGEIVRVLFRGIVPCDEVEVVVDGCVAEFFRVADDSVEVALGGGDEVGVVH